MNLEHLIKNTDALTYINSLKCSIQELKEELATVEETREYQHQAIERARKIMRRIDNQYRAVVKSATSPSDPVEIDTDLLLEDL